jgi:hypothetical protein
MNYNSIKSKLILLKFCCIFLYTVAISQGSVVYQNADQFEILGRPFPEQTLYRRFPDSLKSLLREPLWNFSRHSTGMAVQFETDSKTIQARWKTGGTVWYPHVAATLVKGLDLYGLHKGSWHWAGLGKPGNGEQHTSLLARDLDGSMRTYLMYLPDYETLDSLFIAVDSGAVLRKPVASPLKVGKPIVFYGTSIVQGASAMRSGMAYPALVGRKLQRETINLGFSGNGQMDSMMVAVLAAVDASAYVIDCGPNMSAEMVKKRCTEFLRNLMNLRPGVSVLLVENIEYPTAYFNTSIKEKVDAVNKEFQKAYKLLRREGYRELRFVRSGDLIGRDGEAAVDGVHLTDLGFFRMAEGLARALK